MNTYYVHMLERAREVYEINYGQTGRDSVVKCPFCIADEDEQWFKFKFEYRLHPEVDSLERPKRMPAPICQSCPLISLFGINYKDLMNDCVDMGATRLYDWETLSDEDS